MSRKRHSSLQALLFVKLGLLVAGAQNVTLTDSGSTVTLANGIVSAVITKSNGKCTDLRQIGGANLLANGGQIYFDANGATNGGASLYDPFVGSAYRVVTNTPTRVEIALNDTDLVGFNVELHYTLRSGDSGLYVHTVWRHGPGNPQVQFEQSRMVIRCDPDVFTQAYTSAEKTGQMIAPILLQTNLPTIMDATYQLPLNSGYTNATGFTEDHFPVYTKYDWSDYMENHTIHGLSGETTGLWMIMGSVEYFNGGPTKQNQKVHGTDTTPLMLWVFHGQHFGSSKIEKLAGEPWDKIMGPYFIYVNSGTNAAQLWQDAQDKAAAERTAWPYSWVTETNYPIARGSVSGRLHILGESSSNALMVLAQPGSYWQWQSEGYQFWTRAAADGSFTIPKVRPGNYTLYTYVPGIVGEYSLAKVTVSADQTNSLGLLEWNPPRRERRLWRIGTPDLSAREFRFGDQMRQFGLWWRYLEEQGTNNLVYRIGTSTATNWYYAQSTVAMDDGTYFSPTWKIEFVLTNLPPAPAVLTVDMSGTLAGTLLTTVNGSALSNVSLTNDASIYRSGTRSGMFRQVEWSFAPNLLQLGTNTISFFVSKPASWTGSKPVQPGRGLMYDCIQLEAGNLITTPEPRFDQVFANGSDLIMKGSGGLPGGWASLLFTTNAALPMTGWTEVASSQCDGDGNFAFTNAISPAARQNFYRLKLP
jgi:rhamnogalacturonan endolyase